MFHVKHAGPFCFADGLRRLAQRGLPLRSKVLVRGASVRSAEIQRLCGRERLATSVVFASRRVDGAAILLVILLGAVGKSAARGSQQERPWARGSGPAAVADCGAYGGTQALGQGHSGGIRTWVTPVRKASSAGVTRGLFAVREPLGIWLSVGRAPVAVWWVKRWSIQRRVTRLAVTSCQGRWA